ncbi:hypothetical protein TCAL_08718 [Tigriopus californicus]|uniref:Protein-lysine N-methyltransferase SMYD4 n=1 Tax=Tigriopus californicus TaxID=6832 RepID=A0A553P0I9_TIGCA|nr:SET and MYND domain-containing protein 4-like [Tigriopus californicus]TRY71205.1 hypothetical protein TCAL_08718 [Tigriopus californicus]|eukprot:TCALIF_08718-PA protein Name:"Similar to Smyd4 SET and MYND domain-containing protein 4 (Mus musculus)" AED:0.00 eAED:0.00 QI:200/1/0.66/1/1/1/3/0/553
MAVHPNRDATSWKKVFFSEFYANVRMFFSQNHEAYDEFNEIQDVEEKIRYLCRNPVVQAESEKLMATYNESRKPLKRSNVVKAKPSQKTSKPWWINPKSVQFPQMHAQLAVKDLPGKGRALVAQSKIQAGELLISESPFVHNLYYDYLDRYCFHCSRRLLCEVENGFQTCTRCQMAKFCSKDCLEASVQAYHWAECAVLEELIHDSCLGPMAPLVYRTLIKTGLEGILSTIKERDTQLDPPRYDSQDYFSVYMQATNYEKREGGEVFRRCVTSIYLSHLLQFAEFFGTIIDSGVDDGSHDERLPITTTTMMMRNAKRYDDPGSLLPKVCGVMVRHMMSCSCNAYELSELTRGAEKGLQSLELGGAVYANVSLSNHSCYPNTLRYNEGTLCIVRAVMDINKGEEITDNYGYFFQSLPKPERQTQLAKQYHFICNCRACRENWSTVKEMSGREIAFKCRHCQSPAPTTALKKCQRCRKELQLGKVGKKVENVRRFALQTAKSLTIENADKMRQIYTELLNEIKPNVILPCYDILLCEQIISHCYTIKGNFHQDQP